MILDSILLKSLALICFVADCLLTADVNLAGIAQGDRVIYDLQSYPGSTSVRWPVFNSFKDPSLKLYAPPITTRCFKTAQQEVRDYEILDFFEQGSNEDRFLIRLSNGSITLVESMKNTGVPVFNHAMKDLGEGSILMLGYIYSYGGFGNLTYRVYYKTKNSNELRFYDDHTKFDGPSTWQPKTDVPGAKIVVVEGASDPFLAVVVESDKGSHSMFDMLKIVQLVEPQSFKESLIEKVFDLGPALESAGLSVEVATSHFAGMVDWIKYNDSTISHNTIAFGGSVTNNPANFVMYTCVLSNLDDSVSACTIFANVTLQESETFISATSASETRDSTKYYLQLLKKRETGHFYVFESTLTSVVTPKSLNPLVFTRKPYKPINMAEHEFSVNCTTKPQLPFNRGMIIDFNQPSGSKDQYIITEFLSKGSTGKSSGMILPPSYKQLRRARSSIGWRSTNTFAIVDNDGCVNTFKEHTDHYIDIDTAKYPNNSRITLWYYKPSGGAIQIFNDTVVLNYTGGNPQFAVKKRSVSVFARSQSTFQIDTDASWVSGFFQSGPDLKFEGDVSPSVTKINANRLRLFHSSQKETREIQSGNVIATTEKIVDLQNMHAYANCDFEVARDIAVVCRVEFNIQFKHTFAAAVSFYRDLTVLVLLGEGSSSSSLAVVDHGNKRFRELALPEGSKHHAIKVFNNFLVCVYATAEGELGSTHVDADLSTFRTWTSTYGTRDVLKIVPAVKFTNTEISVMTKTSYMDYAIRWRFNASNPEEKILELRPQIQSSSKYPGLRFTDLCKISVDGRDYTVTTEGSKIFLRKAVSGAWPIVGIQYHEPLENFQCGPSGIYFKSGQNLVKIPTDGSIKDFIADRYFGRSIFNIGGNADLIYTDDLHEFVVVNEGHSRSLRMLNPKGTSFVLSRAPDRAFLEYLTIHGSAISIPLDLKVMPDPSLNPVNLSKQGNYTYANGKLNFTIEVGASGESTEGHLWGFDDAANPRISVQNRFGLVKDLSYGDHYEIVDVDIKGLMTAYLVKDTLTLEHFLVIKSVDFEHKIILFNDSDLGKPPVIDTLYYTVKDSSPLVKVVVGVWYSTGNTRSIRVEYHEGKFDVKPDNMRLHTNGKLVAVSADNTTFHAAAMPENNIKLTVECPSGWWYPLINLGKIDQSKVDQFALTAIDRFVLIFIKHIDSHDLKLYSMDAHDKEGVITNASLPLEILKESSLHGIECAPAKDWFRVTCVFFGSQMIRVELKIETDRKSMSVVKMVDYEPYKNMQVERAVIVDTGVIMVGRRNDVSLNTNNADQFGIMFYPLDVRGNYREKSAFMVGGLDKIDMERLGLSMACKIVRGPESNQVIIGNAESGFKIFNIDHPTVVGKFR